MIQPQEKVHLLVVDDDQGMAATLRDILGASGYGVDVAFSGEEAVEQVKARRPDGILMDVRMPEMNGVETFRKTRELAPESFVIFMTAFSESALVDDAWREGALQVVPKPLDVPDLLRLIERAADPAADLRFVRSEASATPPSGESNGVAS